MKTKEQILEEELSEDLLKILEQENLPEELRYFKRYVLDAMEEYAQQQVKKLNEPAVIKSVCEHPWDQLESVMGDGVLCRKCNTVIKQTVL